LLEPARQVDSAFEELLPADGVAELRLIKDELERQFRAELVRDYDAADSPLRGGTASESTDGADPRR
jgi:hypothetical protein